MTKGKKHKQVLSDHKKIGKRLIPPLLQIDKLVETSFVDEKLPHLIWIASVFLNSSDRDAVNLVMGFLRVCEETIADENSPALAFLGNFNKLTEAQKTAIRTAVEQIGWLSQLQAKLFHQRDLLTNFPLEFLFDGLPRRPDKEKAVQALKADVSSLLDRHSHHATKVQTTAFFSMAAAGKVIICPPVTMPDPNVIFTAPESDEGKHVASFVRASLNAGTGLDADRADIGSWPRDFWQQVFLLGGCT